MNAITLDQFLVFLTIVEEGSFAAAARKLSREKSAITYAIQKLEEQSNLLLFDRSTYRPSLTEQGRAMLPRIQRVIEDVNEFRVQAKSISQGEEAEIIFIIETFLPLSLVTSALQRFHEQYPMVQLRINSVPPQDAQQQLLTHRADFGLFMLSPKPDTQLENRLVTEVEFVAVSAPNHPLAKLPPGIPTSTMREHLQIIVSDPKPPKDTNSSGAYGVMGINQWRVSNVRLRYELIKDGIGWGSMPKPMVEDDLARGTLVLLEPAQWGASDSMPSFKVVVAKHKEKPLGPAAQFLMNAIIEEHYEVQ